MLLLYMKQPHKNIVFYKSWMSMKQENMVGNFNYLIGHQASQIVKEQAPCQNSNETSRHWLKTKKEDYLYSNLLLGTYNPNDISQTQNTNQVDFEIKCPAQDLIFLDITMHSPRRVCYPPS